MSTEINPTLFGGTGMPDEFKDEFGQQHPQVAVPAQMELVSGTAVLDQTAEAAQGRALAVEANREKAGFFASLGAGMALTHTASVLSTFNMPDEVPDPNWAPGDALRGLNFAPTTDEIDFLQRARSAEGFNWRLGRVQDLRIAARAAGDNPITGAIPQFLDPVYLALGAVTGGTATSLRLGRVAAGIADVAGTAGIVAVAQESTPMSMQEAMYGALLSGATTAMVYRGGRLAKADPDFPGDELTEAASGMHPRRNPDAVAPDSAASAARVEAAEQSWAARVGEKLQWNMRKTLASYSDVGSSIADVLFDNNSNLARTSVESHHRAIRSSLTPYQRTYEDLLRQQLANEGFGTVRRILNSSRARAAQYNIENEVKLEMFRREQLARQGRPISSEGVAPHITRMADELNKATAAAAKEMKAAGVRGAEELEARTGWLTRKWNVASIEAMQEKFMRAGRTAVQADQAVKRLVATALRRANGWDNETAYDIGASIVNRAIRKGYFEDSAFNVHQGKGTLAQMRDILQEEGLSGPRLERALAVLEGRNAEAGKPGFLKRRLDLDYTAATVVDGELLRVTDLIDSDIATNLERYLDNVSAQSAWARAGYADPNAIDALRQQLSHSIRDSGKRLEAVRLFDNATAFLRGDPAGEAVNPQMRLLSQWGRMISLANSGLWQATEYATVMGRYGFLKTTKYAIREMPLFRKLWKGAVDDPRTSGDLYHVLSRQAEQDLRLRPFIQRFEDNFEMSMGDAMHMRFQQAEQLVPILNGMKYIHHHQARITANLIVDRVRKAVSGDKAAREALAKYGIESRVTDRMAREIREFGLDTSKWSDETWAAVRPAFSKMMDEAVLHARLGDMPAFARFDKVGKFIFTYRSFMLAAHNKILAGSLSREGSAGLGMILMYQMPLAMMAVRAQAAMQGKELDDEKAFQKAVGQMGALGFFSEAWGVVSGQKGSFGAPGLIPIDRVYSVAGDAAQGKLDDAAVGMLHTVPLLPLIPFTHQLKSLEQ